MKYSKRELTLKDYFDRGGLYEDMKEFSGMVFGLLGDITTEKEMVIIMMPQEQRPIFIKGGKK